VRTSGLLRHLFAASALILLAMAAWQGQRLAGLGSAFTAKYLCLAIFVAGRAASTVMREDLPAFRSFILGLVDWEVDHARGRVRADILGLGRREAVHRPGLGCTLALDGPPVPLPTPPPSAADDSGWPPAAPPPPALLRAVEAAFAEPDPRRPRRTRAVIVLHRGRLLIERYAPGYTADTRFPGWSMSKSVLNALTGILVAEGRLTLKGPAPVAAWSGPQDPRRGITPEHLLTMSSGLAFDEDYDHPLSDVVRMLYESRDTAAFAAARPLLAAPGSRFSYSTGSSAILSRIVADAAGAPWPAFARRALFDPLGMRSAQIEPDSAGTPQLAAYVWANARDWARFGLLYLHDGIWLGRRLLPPGWVAYSRTPAPADRKGEYAAHFWVRVPHPDRLGPGRPHLVPADAFHAAGHGAQYVTVIPSRALVVVRLGLALDPGSWDHEAFLHEVVAAVDAVGSQCSAGYRQAIHASESTSPGPRAQRGQIG
jgi:CubicO group peptidase (beta-lactamase class C family)